MYVMRSKIFFVFVTDAAVFEQILARIVAERSSMSDVSQDPSHPLNFTALATLTDGYSATDLRDLVGKAIHEAALRSSKLFVPKVRIPYHP